MNKLQAEGDGNSHLYSRGHGSNKSYKTKSFLLISMIELDHQMSTAKTLFNKMGLNT